MQFVVSWAIGLSAYLRICESEQEYKILQEALLDNGITCWHTETVNTEESTMTAQTLNGNQTTIPGVPIPESASEPKQSNRRGSPLMHGLKPEYLSHPEPLDFANGMWSDQFCFEKCNKIIVEQLGFQSEKDWLAFAKQVWQWQQQAEAREKEAIANDVLRQIEGDPKLLEIVKAKLSKAAS